MSFVNILMGLVLACQKVARLGRFNLDKVGELVTGYLGQARAESEHARFFADESRFFKDFLYSLNSILFEFRDVLEFVDVGGFDAFGCAI